MRAITRMVGRLFRKVFVVWLGFALLTVGADAVTGFRAEGTLQVTSMNLDGSVFKSESYGFVVDSDERFWQIKATYGENHYQVFGYDGTNVYSFLADQDTKARSIASGQITEGKHPMVATWHVTVPWLAYASRSYFHGPHTNGVILPAPWIVAAHDSAAHIFRARYSDITQPFGVPKHIEFVVDQSLIERAATDVLPVISDVQKTMSHPSEVLRALTKDGSLVATYAVLRTKVLREMEVPAEFELTVFRDARRVQLQMRGIATNISVSSLQDFVPRTEFDIGVADFRFRDTNAGVACIKYVVSRGEWVTDRNSPRLTENLKRSSVQQRLVLDSHRRFLLQARGLFWGILLLVIFAPFVLRGLRSRTWRRRNIGKSGEAIGSTNNESNY